MPVTTPVFESFAQNREDVVLWRALGHLTTGRYVDVGANHPTVDSISRAFYDRGWRGITIEPVPGLADAHRAERPGDIVVEAAITDSPEANVTLHVVDDSGLSTLDDHIARSHADASFPVRDLLVAAERLDAVLAASAWGDEDIHFMTIDVEGSETAVLRTLDLHRWRPWVLVIEATRPRSNEQIYGAWEGMVSEANYEFCLFDGLSRYYVAKEHSEQLRDALSYPACALDDFVDHETVTLRQEVAALEQKLAECRDELAKWRSQAVGAYLADGRIANRNEIERVQRELEAIRKTVSWRITKPLRVARSLPSHMANPST